MPKMLSIGATGADVIDLQKRLNSRPPTSFPLLKADGSFGARTQVRVMEFQRNNGLKADGIVGPITIAALLREEDDLTFEEFQKVCDDAVAYMRRELRADPVAVNKGVTFFNQQRARIQLVGFPGAGVSNAFIAPTVGPPVFGALVLGVVVVVLIIAAFFLACMIILAQMKGANPLDINRLIVEFGNLMTKIERELFAAGLQALILLAIAMSAVEKIIRQRIEELKRQMDRCRLNNAKNFDPRCAALAQKVATQMAHLVQQATLATLIKRPNELSLLLLGIARSFGALMLFISDWARCMGCQFLIFF